MGLGRGGHRVLVPGETGGARPARCDPADFDMVGMLGRVSSTVCEGGTGEMIFSQDGARKAAPIRSEDGQPIGRAMK